MWVSGGSPGTDGHAWGAEDRWVAIEGLWGDWIGLLVLPVLVPWCWGAKTEDMRVESKPAPVLWFTPCRSCSPVTGGAEEPDLGGESLCGDNTRTLTTAHRTDTTPALARWGGSGTLTREQLHSFLYSCSATTAQAAGSVALTA